MFTCSEEIKRCVIENFLPHSSKTPGQQSPKQKIECLSPGVPVCSFSGPFSVFMHAAAPVYEFTDCITEFSSGKKIVKEVTIDGKKVIFQ